ncbi:cytochrome o ubiquinol oxidase subunit IV [Amphibiibacter pelophylacis]|uniref:Cytochrome o ubiquinol oxidase subunit IV n=1 Tax=Amphibiibacter pelophylacis TaxID=1799477 RepID=A0ACC6P523_9BURK
MSSHSSHDEHSTATVKSYSTGFILSIILTVIPFALIMTGAMTRSTAVFTIAILAVVQILVQIYYFLHIDFTKRERWNLGALAFTAFIVGIVIVGSLWIMYHMNANMMYVVPVEK